MALTDAQREMLRGGGGEMSERYGRALEHNATVNTAAADKALAKGAGRGGGMGELRRVAIAVFFPNEEDGYYVKAEPGETKRLDAAELERIQRLTGREVRSAAETPLEMHEWVGQKLLDHIAWQEREIARLEAELQAARAVVDVARLVIQTAEGKQREEIHLLAAALAALDDVEVGND